MRRFVIKCCTTWRYYLIGCGLWTVLELFLILTRTRAEFISDSLRIGIWGILATIIYKTIVISLMVATRPKTTLDRRWIWHMVALLALFAYSWTLNRHPEWHGLPRSPRIQDGPLSDRIYVSAIIWFQIWGFVQWSALSVLTAAWQERGRFIWDGTHRRLRGPAE